MAASVEAMNRERLRGMFADFESGFREGKKNPGTVLRRIVTEMPKLEEHMLEAVGKGTLAGFRSSSRGQKTAGDYDPEDGCIYLRAAHLREAADSTKHADGIRYTLAHEIQHALDKDAIVNQDAALRSGAERLIAGGSPRDYTALLQKYLEASVQIEVEAEIAGFNAFADHVKSRIPDATLHDLYEASPQNLRMYVDTNKSLGVSYLPKEGLSIDEKLRIASTPENVSAMTRHFFDANDYRSDELGRALKILGEIEMQAPTSMHQPDPFAPRPAVHVDCGALGIDPGLLPDGFIDGRAPERAQAQEPDRKRLKLSEDASEPPAIAPDQPSHPDHAFYRFLRERLPDDAVPDNAVAHAMLLAKSKGILDAQHVAEAQVGFVENNRSIAIGGNLLSRDQNVLMPVDVAFPMQRVAEELESLRSGQSQSALPSAPQAVQGPFTPRH